MKHIITCICIMLATGLMAQTAPSSSSEARRMNMSKINGKAALNNNAQVMTDGNANVFGKSDIGVKTSVVDGGLEILGFDDNSMAKAAKLKKGDIITSVNNKIVATIEELDEAISSYEPGDVVTISYTRGIRKLTKEVRVNRK